MRIPFSSSPTCSVGIEWELELVDRETRHLTSAASPVLAEMAASLGVAEHPKAKHELLESTIEVISGVSSTVGQATADLAGTVAEVTERTRPRGIGLLCSGTHPMTDWQTQDISPNPRYARLVEDMQWLARRLQIFGVHVHIGVRAPEKAIPIVNAMTSYVPHLLALSASSPYWVGRDTGLASARSKVFEGLPTAGLPYQLSGWPDFERYMQTLISARTIRTVREVWWDIRPHPEFGTVEMRVCDGLPTLREVGTIAALTQCLVDQLDRQLDRGYTLPRPASWVVRENKWRAARYGLDGEIIVDDSGRTRALREVVADLADELAPAARRLGCAEELAGIEEILTLGNSAKRQRAVAEAAGGDLRAVVDSLVAEFEADRPGVAVPGAGTAPPAAAVT